MADLGRIVPIYGRWHWPYREMQIGDQFHVSYADREPERTRQLATVRAAQLGIRLRTWKSDALQALCVERIAQDEDNSSALPKAMSYEMVRALLRQEYALNADAVSWGKAIEAGESFEHPAVRIGDDPRKLVECEVAGHRYAVELRDDRLVVTHLGSQSLKDWQDARLRAMLD